MKKYINLFLKIILLLTIFTSCNHASEQDLHLEIWDGAVAESFESGSGTSDDPYKIATPAQLAYLAEQVSYGESYSDCYFVLTSNMDLNNIDWTPIGNGITGFQGHFDGSGNTIKNLKISNGVRFLYKYPSAKSALYYNAFGLFATVQDAEIKNLTIDTAEILVCMNENITCVHAGVLCGSVRTFEDSTAISNIRIKNTKIVPQIQSENELYLLSIGGLIGHAYSTENTVTSVNNVEIDVAVPYENYLYKAQQIGAIAGNVSAHNSEFKFENINSYLNLKIVDNEDYSDSYHVVGALAASQASAKPFVMKNIVSKITVNKNLEYFYDLQVLMSPQYSTNPDWYTAYAVIGDAYCYAPKNDPEVVGYALENVFGYIEHIDDETGKRTISTNLYCLPNGIDFVQTNCLGCETLPSDHGLDESIWDTSDLANPKLK